MQIGDEHFSTSPAMQFSHSDTSEGNAVTIIYNIKGRVGAR